ncbi:MAG: phosphate-transport ATP-binding protein transporter pstB [Acidimicrobiales bacterium]|nr:phosphate-transport ATP-binding protein transporter pstB [Acidimicrobiales bacterium]
MLRSMSAPLFELDHVVVSIDDGSRILDVEHLAVPHDGITVLAGPSGAGKSTLLRLCNRLEVPTSGTIRYRGDDIGALDPLKHRRSVGMVFQRPTLFGGTVRANLAVARPDADDAVFIAALERAGLAGSFLSRIGDDLSGGEAQRACLARTLLTQPRVLLLDEPTSSLDQVASERLERSVRALADDGVGVIWVSHDLAQVRRISDRVVVLDRGRVVTGEAAARWLCGPAGDVPALPVDEAPPILDPSDDDGPRRD